jgi:hypothetical protein
LRSETDRLPITTTLFLSDGNKKIITDFGGNTSFTLSALYQAFEEMISDTYDQYKQRQEYRNELINDMMGAFF